MHVSCYMHVHTVAYLHKFKFRRFVIHHKELLVHILLSILLVQPLRFGLTGIKKANVNLQPYGTCNLNRTHSQTGNTSSEWYPPTSPLPPPPYVHHSQSTAAATHTHTRPMSCTDVVVDAPQQFVHACSMRHAHCTASMNNPELRDVAVPSTLITFRHAYLTTNSFEF
jgi:hypothetical protein